MSDLAEAIGRLRRGVAQPGDFDNALDAAETYDSMVDEYVFTTPHTGVYYVTQNEMMAEVMHAGKPDGEVALVRKAPRLTAP